VMVLVMLNSERQISRREGSLLIGYYAIYVVLVLSSSMVGG